MTPPAAADPAASAARDPGSFRDPSGFVFWLDGRPYRQIQQRFATEWDGVRRERAGSTADRTGTAPPVRSGIPRSRPGARRPRGDRTRADRVHQLPVRVDVRRAARRGAPDARRPARRARRRLDAPRRLGVQRPVPRRPPGPDRLPVVRAARGRHAVGRVPPVLRALPGAAGADGPARRAPGATCCAPSSTASRSTSPRSSCRGARGSTSGCCRTSTCTPARSGAMPATTTTARPPAARGSRATRLTALVGNLRSTVKGLDWSPAGTEWADYADHTSYGDAATADKDAPRRGVRSARCPVRGRGTSARTPAATAGSPPTPASGCSPSTSTRPPPSSTTARCGRKAADRHPAAGPRSRQPEPGARLGGPRAPVAARAGRRGRRPGPRAGPPPRDLAQRAAADGARTCSPTSRRGRSSSSCPKEDPMVRRLLASRRTSSPTTPRRASGPRPEIASRSWREQPIAGEPARPVPAAAPLADQGSTPSRPATSYVRFRTSGTRIRFGSRGRSAPK